MTDGAVRVFQVKHGQEILKPWVDAGLHPDALTGTDYVYKTTSRFINNTACPPLNLPMPILP